MIYDRLLPILESAANSKEAVDVHELNSALTMDFVSAYLYGLQNASNLLQDVLFRKHLLHNYQCRKPFEFYYQEVPGLVTLSQAIGLPIIPQWCRDATQVMDEWNMDLCDKAEKSLASDNPRIEPTVYKQMKLSMAKQMTLGKDDPKGNAQKLKQQKIDIACETYDQLTAGHETSAVGLTYLYWELSKHPEIQDELRKELRTLSVKIGRTPVMEFVKQLPGAKEIDALPLLHAVIMETLRLHAPIPGIQPRVTPAPSSTLAGYANIPPNIRVSAQAYSLHRNPEVFPEPEAWQPRRWLKEYNTPEMEEMRRWFWAFGSGGRMCVGSNFAIQEMKLVTAAIYSNFKSTIVDDDGIEAIDAYTVKPTSDRLILEFERETEWTKSGQYTGITELELTSDGIAQVQNTGRVLVGPGKLIDPSRVAHVYVSPRQRAQATFDLLFSGSSSLSSTSDRVSTTDRLAEWAYGEYEGMVTSQIRALRKEHGLDSERPWDIWRDGCEGGESAQEVTDRLDDLIKEIRTFQANHMHGEPGPADIVLVAHGHLLRAFVKRWLGYPMEFPLSLMLEPGGIGVLSYQHHNVNEPALFAGMAFPSAS
ncbi:hypothetical protein UA08_05376 [Talaromyces atroroseus]|uniref:Cytochrome P450 n=1 Tax=Talaromyces atroroseus TaxID=1441469 RepID=A0A225ALW9_TALAT|nr:hypothetical protein UA08_05376 [Talaromyces atroroseus]OKL59314.1 hypothetical protein UA08_05376 [Talaromyces atroroseus]